MSIFTKFFRILTPSKSVKEEPDLTEPEIEDEEDNSSYKGSIASFSFFLGEDGTIYLDFSWDADKEASIVGSADMLAKMTNGLLTANIIDFMAQKTMNTDNYEEFIRFSSLFSGYCNMYENSDPSSNTVVKPTAFYKKRKLYNGNFGN